MGKRSVRFLNDRTRQAWSLTAAIVTVIPCRKGSVLEAGRVSCNPSSLSNNKPLVMCHWAKSSSHMFSSHVNSSLRKRPQRLNRRPRAMSLFLRNLVKSIDDLF